MKTPTIQYAHGGRWHVMGGSGVPPEGYEAYVANANERDGWPRWRIADASTDGEAGAPVEPVRDPTPFTEEETRDFLALVQADMDGTIDAAGRARMRGILHAHRFERLVPEAMDLVDGIDGRRRPARTIRDGEMTITREDIEEQLRRDREAVAAMDPRERERLQRIVDVIRTPSGTNFTDPEAL